MTTLKTRLKEKIEEHRPRTTRLLKEFGKVVIDEVTIDQCIGGARDIKCLVTDLSYLDSQEGIRFRGKNIPETFAALPKLPGAEYPTVESFWFFMLTGEIPSAAEAEEVHQDFKSRAKVPAYVFDVLRALPKDSHPMVMLSTAVLAMQKESKFNSLYHSLKKNDYWDSMYEDACDLLAKLPEIAAFAHMMGIAKPYDDVSRMYFILHSDHESGNVSAHTTHLVASALSDAYYSFSAGLNGLAGPLHGLANQEVLDWIKDFQKKLAGAEPTEENVKQALWQKHLPNDPLFKLVNMIYRVAPGVLTEQGKTKNPWPNVDAQSGVIQWYYGLTDYDFYTVLFGVGRAIGVLANITWDRALGYALERPKSVTTAMLEEWATKGGR